MLRKRKIILSIFILFFFGCANNVAEDSDQDCIEAESFYVETIAPILSQNCVGCHSGGSPSGDLRLDSFTSVRNSMESTLDRVNRDQGSAGFMPQGGSKLTEEQLISLQAFFEMDCE